MILKKIIKYNLDSKQDEIHHNPDMLKKSKIVILNILSLDLVITCLVQAILITTSSKFQKLLLLNISLPTYIKHLISVMCFTTAVILAQQTSKLRTSILSQRSMKKKTKNQVQIQMKFQLDSLLKLMKKN